MRWLKKNIADPASKTLNRHSKSEMVWQRQSLRQRQQWIGFVPLISSSFTFTGHWSLDIHFLSLKSSSNHFECKREIYPSVAGNPFRCVSIIRINLFSIFSFDKPLPVRDDGPFLMQSTKWLHWKCPHIRRCHAYRFEMEMYVRAKHQIPTLSSKIVQYSISPKN